MNGAQIFMMVALSFCVVIKINNKQYKRYNNDKRYKKYSWVKLRKRIIARDNNECQWCKSKGKVSKAEVVHHIKEANEYPHLFYDPDNLVSLCRNCHERHHGRLGLVNKMQERFPETW